MCSQCKTKIETVYCGWVDYTFYKHAHSLCCEIIGPSDLWTNTSDMVKAKLDMVNDLVVTLELTNAHLQS